MASAAAIREDDERENLVSGKKPESPTSVFLKHMVLVLISLTTLAPFVWMVLTSFKPLSEVSRLNPIPSVWHPENYHSVFTQIPFAYYYFNSVLVASWVTFLQVFTSSLAAFAFARLRWPGRDSVFRLYLATLMIPGVVVLIPNYAEMVKLHLYNSYFGLIVPASFTAFGTFMLRQFMLTLPRALDEAASIDGASPWVIFWDIVLPLSRAGVHGQLRIVPLAAHHDQEPVSAHPSCGHAVLRQRLRPPDELDHGGERHEYPAAHHSLCDDAKISCERNPARRRQGLAGREPNKQCHP
jgi:ABC-type glycerol-3-phosphate transport system permease component